MDSITIRREIVEHLKYIILCVNNQDYKTAHSMEDSLMRCFIYYIANNCNGEIGKMAKLVMTIDTLDYPRW